MENIEDNTWEVEETEQDEVKESDAITYQISYYPADITLKGYLDKWNGEQLLIPPFQRSFVWDQVRASKLIESFLLGLPVPGVFLYKERSTNKLQVIDGQQRILTAIRYFKNEFGESIFRLRKVQEKWEGKTYAELTESDRFQLDDTVLRATVVQQLDPEDDSSIYLIFERLNTGGINLNPMEIRKCINYGPIFDMLEHLNELETWRKIIGKPLKDKRLRDVEVLLRILALSERWDVYEKPMKGFLNSYMSDASKLKTQDEFIESWNTKFENTCNYVFQTLGEKPFHLRGRLNYAVLDSTMTMAITACENGIDDFKDRFESLLADETYVDDSTRNTSDEKTLTDRFSRAQRILVN